MARARTPRVQLFLALGAGFVFIVVPLFAWVAEVWTDYLWFSDLGQQAVFVTRIVSQIAIAAVFGAVAFALLYVNMRVARRMAPNAVPIDLPEGVPLPVELFLERLRGGAGPILDKAVLGVALVIAFLTGLAMSSDWELFRLAMTGGEFGYTDPQFGFDIGFFVFRLPALRLISDWITGMLVLATALTLVVHLADGAIQPWARWRGFAPHVKAHLSVLMAGVVLSWGFGYWLDIYELSFSPRGQVTGASYTDVHAQIPAYWILIGISVAAAVGLLLNIRYKGWRLPLLVLGVWVGASILIGSIFPSLMQALYVQPNEVRLETPYIERNIEMTRKAFAIEDVEGQPFPAAENLTAQDVLAAQDTLANTRLWDPAIVAQCYEQLQSIRPYYDFADVDVDRYEINGKMRQVLVSAREMNSAALSERAQTWVNRHLIYTHGFGLVMSPSNQADSRGLPVFYLGDVPPRVDSSIASGSPDLQVKQPRLYFGEDTTDYVIVGTGVKEFDYPLGEKNAEYEYTADSGVEIGGFVRRIAWAMRLGSSQIFFSGSITPDSRVLMKRDLTTRLEALAPWLIYEDDPYPVLVDGRVLWVVDAYTASDHYPYAEPLPGGTTYLRNSVKVVVDAYTGETTFYAFDETDPVLAAWRSVFPTLMTDASQIPEGVRAHFRYPQGLFSAQAEVYRTYHMTDARVFYNKEDQWEIPGERKGTPMEPFFVLMELPGSKQPGFYLMQPYTPRNRDNMIGWVAANSGPTEYGQRTVYQFPKERVVLGPEQISARINQDAAISPQLSLWNQRGSNVIFGNMIVIPIEDSIVYIQPLFLQAEQTAIPELTRVVVVYADKVEMDRTLQAALLRVFGERPPTSGEGTQTPDGGGAATDAAAAQKLYEEAIAAQREGDWATYGAKIQELGRVLRSLAGAEATATP